MRSAAAVGLVERDGAREGKYVEVTGMLGEVTEASWV